MEEQQLISGEGLPFFTRIGGKSRLSKQIIKMFPTEYSTYIEPFLGGGKVFLEMEKRPKVKYVLNDKNKDIYYLWKDAQVVNPDIVKRFTFPQSKEFFDELKGKTNLKNRIDRFYRNIYLSNFSYSGDRLNFMEKRKSKGTQFLKKFEELQQHLKGVVILNQDYKKVIERYDNPSAIIYLDPPYFGKEKLYEGQAIDPEELAQVCRSIKGKFILSYNITPEVRKAFEGFNIKTIPLQYTVKKKEIVNEYIITNF
jgi:DNA adenine methylase